MKIVMDSDCLVKLTKSGVKEAVLAALETSIPLLVQKETVEEAKKRDYPDAFIIEDNVHKRMLRVVPAGRKRMAALPVSKGEAEVMALYLDGGYDAVASDDKRFLKKLEAAGIPYLTASACVVFLNRRGKASRRDVVGMLNRLRPFISAEEYEIARYLMEGKP